MLVTTDNIVEAPKQIKQTKTTYQLRIIDKCMQSVLLMYTPQANHNGVF